jgi:hypothetical protein
MRLSRAGGTGQDRQDWVGRASSDPRARKWSFPLTACWRDESLIGRKRGKDTLALRDLAIERKSQLSVAPA